MILGSHRKFFMATSQSVFFKPKPIPQTTFFLGIDSGTQSTKTIALDWESGEIFASAKKNYGFVPNLPPGAMEQDPKDWIEAAEQSIGEVIAKLGALKDEVRGIGVSG